MRDDSTDDISNSSYPTANLPVPAPRPLLRPIPDGVDLVGCLGNAARAIEQVVLRQVSDDVAVLASNPEAQIKRAPDGVRLDSDDPILDTFSRLVSSFKNGESTEPIKEDLTRLVTGQEERADLLNNLLVLHDADRLPAYLKARRSIENYLLVCTERADLTAVEALAFLKIIQAEIESITSRIRSGTTPVKDVEHLIEKADFVNQLDEVELAKKFETTTPQGREILRKISYRILKNARPDGS